MTQCPRCEYPNSPDTLLCQQCGARLKGGTPHRLRRPAAELMPPDAAEDQAPIMPGKPMIERKWTRSVSSFGGWGLVWGGAGALILCTTMFGTHQADRDAATAAAVAAVRLPAPAPPVPPLVNQEALTKARKSSGAMVYLGGHGRTYHRRGCEELSRRSEAISRTEARERGYRPCSECNPP